MNVLAMTHPRSNLTRFTAAEIPVTPGRRTKLFALIIVVSYALVGGLLVLTKVPDAEVVAGSRDGAVRINLDPVVQPKPVTPEPKPDEIARLEPQTILAAPEDRPAIESPEPVVVTPQDIPAPAEKPVAPRRVYGVRKVYAKGLGTGGQGGGGLVTKQGNTLGGQPDSLIATEADLKGKLAALSSVDQAPEPVHRAKPGYSPAMRKARVEGQVTAYLLVAVDGSVKDVKITADIGWDSREVATAALRRFRFRPAQKNGQPVAVWILHHIRFEFQE